MENTIKIEKYTSEKASPLHPYIAKVLKYTIEEHHHGGMASGHEQGLLLSMLSRMKRPYRILEIGTFTGFSALCLAQGLQEGGQLHTIEIREEDVAVASKFIQDSEYEDKIQIHHGDALEVICRLDEKWDLVFIDAEKTLYSSYYKLIKPQLNKGAVIIADNMFVHGKVLENPLSTPSAKGIAEFTRLLLADKETDQMILPLRDGLMLIMNH